MTTRQKLIKYAAMAFAIFLIVNICIGIVSLLGSGLYIFSDEEEGSNKNMTEYPIATEFESLDMDINAAVVEVVSGENFSLESNCEKFSVEEKDGSLVIEEKSKKVFRKEKSKIILTIPQNHMFENVYMSAGAGKVEIYDLSARKMDLNFGAGEVEIAGLTAQDEIKIEGGVGEVSIDRCELNNADINMGVGEFNIAGTITGKSDVEYGVGEANLKLKGSKEDYTIEMKKGLGESKVDGESVKSGSVYGNGENYISVEGGIGEIEVEFY